MKHGGANLLNSRHADRILSQLIREEFGMNIRVTFTGRLEVDGEGEHYKEMQAHQTEKVYRQEIVAQQEDYENSLAHTTEPRVIEVREGENLRPTILPDTARALYKTLPKAKPAPISTITPDIGSLTVWGEIFPLNPALRGTSSIKSFLLQLQTTPVLLR